MQFQFDMIGNDINTWKKKKNFQVMKRIRIKVCNEKQVEPNFALLFCSAYLMMFTP